MATLQTSSFLTIPAELRIQIYQEVLLQADPIPVGNLSDLPPLLLFTVCKQIKHEAEPVFWGENTFHNIAEDSNLKTAVEWLAKIVKEKASLIRSFVIEYKHSKDAGMDINFRVIYWTPEKYKVHTSVRGKWPQINRQYNDEMTCQFQFLVDQVRQLFALGLPKSSVRLVEDAKAPPRGPNERERRSCHANNIMIGMHLAFNKKLLQLSQGTYFHEEEEAVVQVGGWSIMLVFERERIIGRIPQSSYLNRRKLVLDRRYPLGPYDTGAIWRSNLDLAGSLF